MHLTATASGEAAQMLVMARSKWGLGREAWATSLVLRVGTRLECPENNMRGLMWHSQTVGSPEGSKKKGGGEAFTWKALMPHGDTWSAHRTKDCALANTKGEQAHCHLGPSLPGGREATISQNARGRCNLGPRDSIFHQPVSRLPVANHIFLGSWTVHIHQEGHSLISSPEESHTTGTVPLWCIQETEQPGLGRCIRHTAHLCSCQVPGHLSILNLGRAQNTAHWALWLCRVIKSLSGWETWEVHETQGTLGTACLQSTLEPEQCGPGGCKLPWAEAHPVWSINCEHSPHMTAVFACSVPPIPEHSRTSEPG